MDSTGTLVTVFVEFGGIGLNFSRGEAPPLYCSNGSVDMQSRLLSTGSIDFPELFSRIDGRFEYYSKSGSSRSLERLLLRGQIASTGLSGTYRLIETRDGPLCDSGPISFTASPPAR